MHVFLLLFTVLGCTNGTDQALADYDTIVTNMSTLVSDHGAAVAAATTLEEVTTAEDAYLTDWGTLSDSMSKHMDMMGDCTMDADDQSMMDQSDSMMMDMDTAVSDHVSAQAAHTDLASCQSEETDHDAMMNTDLDVMGGYSAGWADSMKCKSSGMGM